jgi:hypothetical protein
MRFLAHRHFLQLKKKTLKGVDELGGLSSSFVTKKKNQG